MVNNPSEQPCCRWRPRARIDVHWLLRLRPDRTAEGETVENRIIILLHGIRTFGDWQNRLSSILDSEIPGIQVHIYKYGYFSTLAFLVPVLRILVISRFRRYLKNQIPRSEQTRVDIVAHSFGTYVIAKALDGLSPNERPKIHTLLLCGSVLKQLFPWEEFVGKNLSITRVINDCGTSDRWPVVAQLFVFGMGIAGRRGFAGVTGTAVGIINRFFPVEHSGFFTDAFMKKNWLPILTGAEVPTGPEHIPPAPRFGAALEYYADPFKLAFLAIPVAGLFYYLQAQEFERQRAEAERIQAESARMVAENQAEIQASLRLTAEAYEKLYRQPTSSVLKAFQADSIRSIPEARKALASAYKVAVLHNYNRREIARFTGSGPGYLAARWKQGDLFSRSSPDGRFRIVVTERGPDGPSPPGEVYLLINESLRTIQLTSCGDTGMRVEEANFDRSSRHIFLARYFHLGVYTRTGSCVGRYIFSRHTKSPVHIVDGYLLGHFIIAGETKGGVWLVDIEKGPKATREIHREFHGDAVTSISISSSGKRATIVYESGKVNLLSFKNDEEPMLTEVPVKDALYAGFENGSDDTIVTAGMDGVVRLWDARTSQLNSLNAFSPQPSPVDWVAFSEDGEYVVAVGADQRIYIIDRETGATIDVVDHSSDIDWATEKQVLDPAKEFKIPAALKPDESLTLEVDRLERELIREVAGQKWMVTNEGTVLWVHDSTVVSIPVTPDQLDSLERYDDVYWFKKKNYLGFEVNEGKAFLIHKDLVRPIPSSGLNVKALRQVGKDVWFGTSNGAYRLRDNVLLRVTREDLPIRVIKPIGGQVWIGTEHGGYVWEDERLIRVTDPFLDVRDFEQNGRELIISTHSGGVFEAARPTHKVKGYFAVPIKD